jgi:hypothetical protein
MCGLAAVLPFASVGATKGAHSPFRVPEEAEPLTRNRENGSPSLIVGRRPPPSRSNPPQVRKESRRLMAASPAVAVPAHRVAKGPQASAAEGKCPVVLGRRPEQGLKLAGNAPKPRIRPKYPLTVGYRNKHGHSPLSIQY